MGSPFSPVTARFGKGLNLTDAPDQLDEGECRILTNYRVTGRGWIGTRKAAVRLGQTPGYRVVAGFPYNHESGVGAVLLEWHGSDGVTPVSTYSEDLEAGNWVPVRGTITPTAEYGPWGGLAYKWVYDSAFPGGHVFKQDQTKAASALPFCASCFVKKEDYPGARLYVGDGSGNSFQVTIADIDVASVLAEQTGSFTVNAGGVVEGEGQWEGWMRIWVDGTTNTGTTVRMGLNLYNGSSINFTGDDVSGNLCGGFNLTPGLGLLDYKPIEAAEVEKVRVVTVDGSGVSRDFVGDLPGYESGVDERPVFSGAVLGRVLFVTDVAKARGMVVYDPNDVLGGATITADFDSGSEEPQVGDTVQDATSSATGVVVAVSLASGSWAGTDAAGTLTLAVAGQAGTFGSGNNVNIVGGTANVLTLQSAFAADVPMYQPTFDFNQDATFDAALFGILVEHENHLWAFGYGDEADPDRGELARISYLGISDDGQGLGDAGLDGRVGSLDLFDVQDYVPVGKRGGNVVSSASSPGRLCIATEARFSVVYGTGRDAWRLDQLDNQRGSVAPLAMTEANGIVYWLSPLGPCRYRGGGFVEDLSRLIDPLLEEIDLTSVFAAHFPLENQVRWYYRLRSDTEDGADRWFGIDYLNEAYVEDVLGYRVFSAFSIRPSGAEAPSGPPTGLTHEAITQTAARARWTPGDTAPGTITRVYRAPDVAGSPGTYILLDQLQQGAGEFNHVGLVAGTDYWTKVEHFRNGQVSSAAEATFTTLALAAVPTPVNVGAEDSPVLWSDGTWLGSVLVTFDPGGFVTGGLKHSIERQIETDGWFPLVTLDVGVTSYRDGPPANLGQNYQYRITAIDQDGNLSAVSATASVVPTNTPYNNWPDE